MDSIAKSSLQAEPKPNLDAIMDDIAALRRDFAKLTGNIRGSADEAARNAAGALGDEAKRLYQNAEVQGERSINALRRRVNEQPVASLLIALALGFIGSRLLSR
jgi:hypothetical protein